MPASHQSGVNVTIGTVSALTGTVAFSNSNGISFGMQSTVSASIITASAANLLNNAIQSLSAGTTKITSGEVVFSNSNGIEFGINGQTLTARLPGTSYWRNSVDLVSLSRSVPLDALIPNLSLQRALVQRPLTATRCDLIANVSVVGSNAGSFTISFGMYTMSRATAALFSSASIAVTFASGATNTTAVSLYGGQSGVRWRSIPLASWSITPGEYMLGIIIAGANATGGASALSVSVCGMRPYGGPLANQSVMQYLDNGYYSSGTVGFPMTIGAAEIQPIYQTNTLSIGSGVQPYIQLVGTF